MQPPPMRPPWATLLPYFIRYAIFRAIERLGEYRERPSPNHLVVENAPTDACNGKSNIWIYVATLGEFNLAARFIERLAEARPDSKLVFITNRAIYMSAYRTKFPGAVIAISDGRTSHVRELVRRFPPEILLVSEIPCWPGDAPCRLHYPLIREVNRSGTPIALINAWIYDYPPSSRADALERLLFKRDYLRSMTLITTQTDEVRARLISAGADERRVHVTGNMKFDILAELRPDSGKEASCPVLTSLRASARSTVVAGCVGKVEQETLISAFKILRAEDPSVRIIVALRHPENPEHLDNLVRLLNGAGISWVKRTEHGDNPLPENCDCLVLDTFGELASFYSVGKLAYVGRDHNVLEPLVYNIPVSVLSDWKPVFPSYPVYRLLLERGLLSQADDAATLARKWAKFLAPRGPGSHADQVMSARLRLLTGASERNLELVLKELKNPKLAQAPGSQPAQLGKACR